MTCSSLVMTCFSLVMNSARWRVLESDKRLFPDDDRNFPLSVARGPCADTATPVFIRETAVITSGTAYERTRSCRHDARVLRARAMASASVTRRRISEGIPTPQQKCSRSTRLTRPSPRRSRFCSGRRQCAWYVDGRTICARDTRNTLHANATGVPRETINKETPAPNKETPAPLGRFASGMDVKVFTASAGRTVALTRNSPTGPWQDGHSTRSGWR